MYARAETSIGEDVTHVMFGIYVVFDSCVPCRVNLTYVCPGHLSPHSFYTNCCKKLRYIRVRMVFIIHIILPHFSAISKDFS